MQSSAIHHRKWECLLAIALLMPISGCAASKSLRTAGPALSATDDHVSTVESDFEDATKSLVLTGYPVDETFEPVDRFPEAAAVDDKAVIPEQPADDSVSPSGEIMPAPAPETRHPVTPIAVTDVVASIHSTFPLLEAAYQQNQITAGNQNAAWGAFDTKLKASSENGPLGLYQTYRNAAGVSRPIYSGGEVFGGYRTGSGNFQPWYLERQTNEGGEIKAGVSVPLLRNREIDARRAELWRATYDRQRAEPEIRAQLILFVRDGSLAYWKWIAAGRQLEIGQRALKLAEQRNAQLKRKVEVGAVNPPDLQDNLRSIAKRESKLIDLRRKLQQAGVKLSLFYRRSDGVPLVPDESRLVGFPRPTEIEESEIEADVAAALGQRPELRALDALARSINVELAEARNDLLPVVNAQIVGTKDMGAPTSRKRDKSQFELEAGVFVEVPVQRRKARGKSQAAQAKLTQLAAKRRFTEDKIRAEILSAFAASKAAFERLDRARESKRLAEYMADIERRKFELGQSDLLSVVLREQHAIEAADDEVNALFELFMAKTDYDAAMAREWPGLD